MMKIKTITCHDVYNYGASLQAYALQTYLESLGHNVEIIDYKPHYLSNHYDLFRVSHPLGKRTFVHRIVYLLIKVPKRLVDLKRKKAFDRFKLNHLKITEKRYCSNEQLKQECPQGDVFIAGSDQIWNCLFPNGKDPAFYLDFVPDNKIKASYAASFAGSTLDEKYHDNVGAHIRTLNHVSVREKSGLDILGILGVEEGVQVLDPVFLLSKHHWEQFAEEEYFEDYLFVYDFEGSDKIRDISLKIAKERNLKIYSVNCRAPYIDRKFLYCGPKTFISLIKHSKFVISNSFHGTAFALIYEKDFVVVKRSEGINARMEDLLGNLRIPERLIDSYEVLPPINNNEVSKKLALLIDKSKGYLGNIVSNRN